MKVTLDYNGLSGTQIEAQDIMETAMKPPPEEQVWDIGSISRDS